MGTELSTPSQVGSIRALVTAERHKRGKAKREGPQGKPGGVSMATQVTTETGEPKGGNEEGIKMKDHS